MYVTTSAFEGLVLFGTGGWRGWAILEGIVRPRIVRHIIIPYLP